MPEPIRFAVLCSGASVTNHAMLMIERLIGIEGVVCAGGLDAGPEPPLPDNRAWRLYRRWYASQPRLSIDDRFPKLPRITEAANIDFILQALPFPLTGFEAAARWGIWALCYGQYGYPPLFVELEGGSPHVPVTLQRLGSPRQILRQGVVNAIPWSYRQTLENAVRAGVDFPALVVKQLLQSGSLPVLDTQAAEPGSPSAGQTVRFYWNQARSWVRYQWSETIRSEMWNVGVVNAPIHSFLDGRYPSRIDWLPPLGPRKFIADPFAVAAGEGFQLLTEEFDYDRYQGYITSALYRPGLPLSESRVLIDEGVHMSYPFPIWHQGQLYCIPECQQRREVRLYRYEEAGRRWVQADVLIRDFAAVDATVIQHDGRWWLFCSSTEDVRDSKLFIWHAPDLLGPWDPHAMNPVKCDVRCSRPGGTPFLHNGELYRPAQDSSTSYGCALSINRVVRLTVDEFEEETVAHIVPPASAVYRDGIHTLSAAGEMTVLDGKRMAPIPSLALRRFLFKLKRLARLA